MHPLGKETRGRGITRKGMFFVRGFQFFVVFRHGGFRFGFQFISFDPKTKSWPNICFLFFILAVGLFHVGCAEHARVYLMSFTATERLLMLFLMDVRRFVCFPRMGRLLFSFLLLVLFFTSDLFSGCRHVLFICFVAIISFSFSSSPSLVSVFQVLSGITAVLQ